MPDLNESCQLHASSRRGGASRATQRHFGCAGTGWAKGRRACAGVVAIAAALVLLCCATAPKPGMGASIDWRDAQGREGSFASAQGHVVVLDICASWATACNLNARVLDEVAAVMTGEPVEIVSLLVDEGAMGREALRSYRETLGVQHRVLLAGSRVRAGTSVLGDVGGVPRLVVLDKTGAVRIDDSGGVVNVKALVDRLQPLLRADGR